MYVNIFFGSGTYMSGWAILHLHSTPNYYLDWKPCLPCRSTIPVSGYTTPFLHAGMLDCSLRLSIKATLSIPTPYFTITTICMCIYLLVSFCDGMLQGWCLQKWFLKLKLKGATQSTVNKCAQTHRCALQPELYGAWWLWWYIHT